MKILLKKLVYNLVSYIKLNSFIYLLIYEFSYKIYEFSLNI